MYFDNIDKIDHNEYLKDISEIIRDIKHDFTPKQIRDKFKHSNSLLYMMGICGHCSESFGDYDDCFCEAGAIVMIQYHIFKANFFRNIETYELMKELHIPLDKKMRRDYHKLQRKRQRELEERGYSLT